MLFDIGGVLERVDDDAWQSAFVARWQERAGLTPEEYRSRLRDVELPPIDRVAGTESAYWRLVGEALGLDAAETARMRAEMWDAYCGEPNAELVAYAAMLRPRAGVAILSNSVDGAREEEERRYGFSAVFDPICYSHELGAAKPERAAYRAALQHMGAAPAEVLFIDDHDEAVDGARACGIHSIRHRDNTTTIATIERFLSEPG